MATLMLQDLPAEYLRRLQSELPSESHPPQTTPLTVTETPFRTLRAAEPRPPLTLLTPLLATS